MIWAYLGLGGWKRFTAVSAHQEQDKVGVEFTIGGNPCDAVAALTYAYAFAQVERSNLPYVFSEREEIPTCE